MKKKPPILSFPKALAGSRSPMESWHNGGAIVIDLYARSLHKAAKTLVETLDMEPNPKTAWDACPVIVLYRLTVELHLKAVVGEGGNFLPSPTDPITLHKTHALRWLAQIVCQIIRAVKWESDFKCEGVACLADFSAWLTNSRAWTRCRMRSIPVAMVVMVLCQISSSQPTSFDSQGGWTAFWICWM